MIRYVIETARLNMRPLEAADLVKVHQISNEPKVRRYLFDGEAVSPAFIQDIFHRSESDFASRKFGIWSITEKGMPDIIGFCGLRSVEDLAETEILYALKESKWHLGYAIEAASAMQNYAFDRAGLSRLIGITDVANVASWSVLEKLGMREYRFANGEDHLRYASAMSELRRCLG